MASCRLVLLRLALLSLVFAACAPAAAPAPTAGAPAGGRAAGQFKLGYSSAFGFSDLPLLITADRLNKQGWKIEHVNFAQSEVAIEAVAKGEVQLAGGSSFTALNATQKGGNLRLLAERNANEWVVAALPTIGECRDLQGKRLAVHSQGAVSTAMVKRWLESTCRGTEPQFLVISGSENRAAALLAGQIDATPLELSDWLKVSLQQPGKFHLLVDFARGLPGLSTSAIYANNDWVTRNRDVAVAFLAELIKTHRQVADNPSLLEEAAKQYVPELDPKSLPDVIKAYADIEAFDPNGGLTREKVQYTLDFFTGPDQLQPGLTVERVADLSVIEAALQEIGKK